MNDERWVLTILDDVTQLCKVKPTQTVVLNGKTMLASELPECIPNGTIEILDKTLSGEIYVSKLKGVLDCDGDETFEIMVSRSR